MDVRNPCFSGTGRKKIATARKLANRTVGRYLEESPYKQPTRPNQQRDYRAIDNEVLGDVFSLAMPFFEAAKRPFLYPLFEFYDGATLLRLGSHRLLISSVSNNK
jgi:hypothetical protein